MPYHAYATTNLDYDTCAHATTMSKAVTWERNKLCKIDQRTGMLLVVDSDGKYHPYTMQMYFDYIRSCRHIITIEQVDIAQAMATMGFLPALCEPTFTNGAYAAYLEPILIKSGLKLYRRPPMAFALPPADMSGTDIWVNKMDCYDKLHIGAKPEHVTVEGLYKALGVTNLETDVRDLH